MLLNMLLNVTPSGKIVGRLLCRVCLNEVGQLFPGQCVDLLAEPGTPGMSGMRGKAGVQSIYIRCSICLREEDPH